MPSVIFWVHVVPVCRTDQPPGYGLLGNFALQLGGRQAEEAAAMPGDRLPVGDQLLNVLRELQQAHEVDDGGAVFAGAQADLLRHSG